MFVWFWQFMRFLAFFFDNIVYGLVAQTYRLILYLANLDLITNNDILQGLISRVYLILGIFMLFKVGFSFLQYLIDPNSFSDNAKGFGKLLTNVMVSLFLLVMTPFIFTELYKLQAIVVESDVIPTLILGQKMNANNVASNLTPDEQMEEVARDVQFAMFSAFYKINTGSGGIESCDPAVTGKINSNILGSTDMVLSTTCFDEVYKGIGDETRAHGGKVSDFFPYEGTDSTTGATVAKDERKFASLGNLLFWHKDGADDMDFVINYTPIISTIVGGYLLFLLLAFCMEIAARAIKLMFLQAVAPIAIISYIDPKESFSQGKLHNWAAETLKTFFSLFLRLALMFLALKLITMFTNMLFFKGGFDYYNGAQPDGGFHIFIFVFLVLGIFTFVKQVPQLIEGIFGIKGAGNFTMNPFKALGENAGVGAILGATVGAGATAISSTATAIANDRNPLMAAKSGLTGAAVGAVRGGRGGFGKNIGDSIKSGTHSGGISARNMLMRRDLGIDYLRHPIKSVGKSVGMKADQFLDRTGGPDLYQMQHAEVQRLDSFAEKAQKLRNDIESNAAGSDAVYEGETYESYLRNLQAAEWKVEQDNKNGKPITYDGQTFASYAEAKEAIDSRRKKAYSDYYT
ncbi:MAG: hypothetical protein IJ093_02930 [Bacilli bacterium]|nr:hypothetical protein [Bacilli bacterium]